MTPANVVIGHWSFKGHRREMGRVVVLRPVRTGPLVLRRTASTVHVSKRMSRHWTEPLRSPAALLLFLGTAAVGLTADLWSKAAAVEHLKGGGDVIRLIPGLVHL